MDAVTEYLRSMLGGEVTHSELSAEDTRKAGWAANLYVLGRASLRGVPCIIAIAKGTVRLAPAAVAKQVARLKEVFGCPVIYVPRAVGPHDVQRLASAGVPFVVPGRCVFLPDMGIALKSGAASGEVVREDFSVAAQLIALSVLLGKAPPAMTFGGAVRASGYSRAAVVHALRELEHFGACERKGDGRNMTFEFRPRAELWELERYRFFNPCKRVTGADRLPPEALLAGVDALAELGDLATGEPRTYAVAMKGFSPPDGKELSPDTARYAIQLWRYPPTALGDGRIDVFSLALSLRDNRDDRVRMAVDKLMEDYEW